MAWLTYCLLVAAVLGLGAVVAERGLRWQGWPGRWAWAASLGLSLGLPAAVWLAPAPVAAPAGILPALAGAYVLSLPSAVVTGAGGPSLAAVGLAAWAAATSLLLLGVTASALRLRSLRRAWPEREVEGQPVLVSERTGPAALGVLRGRVVVPEWALALDARMRRLLVLHEAEHVRAGDPRLAFAGLVACALVPWNPVLWWQLSRLRLAIELDCDERVLRRVGDARGYGTLLLEVGQRRSRLALGLVDSGTMLERRLRMITRTTTGRRTLRALGLLTMAGVALAVACETPGPTELGVPTRDALDLGEVTAQRMKEECEPAVFLDGEPTTMEALRGEEPEGIERIEVIRGWAALEREPRTDRAEGTCGVVWITTKAATPEAEERARRALEELKAARTASREATSPDSAFRASELRRRDLPPKELEPAQDTPGFTPMTVRPRLKNNVEVQRALLETYPPLLRDAGVGGSVAVWFLLDREGRVVQHRIRESSGREELDAAALAVARMMDFTPAYNGDRRVPVWISIDLTFEPGS